MEVLQEYSAGEVNRRSMYNYFTAQEFNKAGGTLKRKSRNV
jgi:hypothetical protein